MADLDAVRATLARIPNPIPLLESLFAFAPVGFQIYEASGRSLLVNQAFLDLFGAEPPPDYNVLQDEIAEKNGVLDLIRRAFKGETVTTPPVWYDPRELTQVKIEKGNRVAMTATFFPLLDRQGAVTHVAIVFKDLTAEMVQREQLEQERELLSAIVDQVSEGILMADERGVFRIVNRAAREIGFRAGTTQRDYDVRLLGGPPFTKDDSPIERALRGENTYALAQYRAPDGKVLVLESRTVPLRRADGSLRGAVAAFRDVTERVRREEEAQQAAHFRERFIGILGHDLRSPLTAILASAGLILRQKDSGDPVLAAAARITGSAERMGRMISDLLDFTQARLGGGMVVKRQPCDLGELARAVVDEVGASDPSRRISLQIEGDMHGSFDPDRAARLLSNLLQNALAYGPPGQPIAVELRGREQDVAIAVSNGGPQIPPAERAVLFDPFRRGRDAPSKESKGLGLGLFIVQQIAHAHGGEAAVESEEGRTTFTVTLQR